MLMSRHMQGKTFVFPPLPRMKAASSSVIFIVSTCNNREESMLCTRGSTRTGAQCIMSGHTQLALWHQRGCQTFGMDHPRLWAVEVQAGLPSPVVLWFLLTVPAFPQERPSKHHQCPTDENALLTGTARAPSSGFLREFGQAPPPLLACISAIVPATAATVLKSKQQSLDQALLRPVGYECARNTSKCSA